MNLLLYTIKQVVWHLGRNDLCLRRKTVTVGFALAGLLQASAMAQMPVLPPKFLRTGEVRRTLVQPDGKILAFGSFSEVNVTARQDIARLNSDGTLDVAFAPVLDGEVKAALLQPDRKLLLAVSNTVEAAPQYSLLRLNGDGTLDTSFSGPAVGLVSSIGLQSNGDILLSGSFSFENGAFKITRLRPDGSRDLSFNNVPRNSGPFAFNEVDKIAIQADDKIVAAGPTRLFRFNPDGTPDQDLNDYGAQGHRSVQLHRINDLVVQTNGRILVACDTYSYLDDSDSYRSGHGPIRFNPDGKIDYAFTSHFLDGVNPLPFQHATALGLQPGEKILIAGPVNEGQDELIRLNSAGEVDPSFPGFIGLTLGQHSLSASEGDQGGAIAVQPDGKPVLAGLFHSSSGQASLNLVRLGLDGAPEQLFQPEFTRAGVVFAVRAQGQDKVIVNGAFLSVDGYPSTDVVRLRADGSVDPTFQGRLFDESHRSLTSLLVGHANEIYLNERRLDSATGRLVSALSRVDADGTENSRAMLFQEIPYIIPPLALQPDGKLFAVVEVQQFTSSIDTLSRYNPNGSRDPSFDGRNDPPRVVTALLLQPDGKLLVGNRYTPGPGFFPPPTPPNDLRRLTADGSAEIFRYPSQKSGSVTALALQPDGRIVIGGTMAFTNFESVKNLARLNGDGSLDETFQPVVNGAVSALKLYDDGRILLGGFFTSVNGSPCRGLARLFPDGTVDPSFNPDFPGSGIGSIALLPQGAIFAVSGGGLLLFPAPSPPLANISTRMRVQGGDSVLIGGFIITGQAPKNVIVRGMGPSLASAGVQDALGDPLLELHAGDGALLASNDNWKDSQRSEIEATTIPPSHDLESAILQTLAPGAYTAILQDKDNTSGTGVVEIYDLSQGLGSKLANISTRGSVETGDNVMIGGFIVGQGASGPAKLLLRGLGPSLANLGVGGSLQDPTLELRDGNGGLVAENDNWKDAQRSQIEATTISPTDDRESAIVANLAPGAYTAILRGQSNTTGIGLVEVYALQ